LTKKLVKFVVGAILSGTHEKGIAGLHFNEKFKKQEGGTKVTQGGEKNGASE